MTCSLDHAVLVLSVLISQILGNTVSVQSANAAQIATEERRERDDVTKRASSDAPKHSIGIRGTFFSGRVQMYVEGEWRLVCSEDWDFQDASVLCKQMGFSRGVLSLNSTFVTQSDDGFDDAEAVTGLNCTGDENSLMECSFRLKICPSAHPATVTCIRNSYSYCNDGEELIDDRCYYFAKRIDVNGLKVMQWCQNRGSHLASVTSQKEHNYLSDRIKNLDFYSIWFVNFYDNTELFQNVTVANPTCAGLTYSYGSQVGGRYNFSHCNDGLPFICEHSPYNIGCTDQSGETYSGNANVTRSGLPCLPWDTPSLPIFIDRGIFNTSLKGHNYCRNPDGSDAPWCYYALGKYDFCDIPQCSSDNATSIGSEWESQFHTRTCPKEHFNCESGTCIDDSLFCDGDRDCVDRDDEKNCPNYLEQFQLISNRTIIAEDLFVIKPASPIQCARYCAEQEDECKAFVYDPNRSRCLFSDKNRSTGATLSITIDCDYYEKSDCDVTQFRCMDGKCISRSRKCDRGVDCDDGSDEADCPCPEFNCYDEQRCCTYRDMCNTWADCKDRSDEVNCTDEIEVRLVNGTNATSGRVEIRYHNMWGTICDNFWDIKNAQVICRMLGYDGSSHVHYGAQFGHGSGPIMLDNVQCLGSERSILECEKLPWYTHDCTHRDDVGVTCRRDSTPPPEPIEEETCTAFSCRSGECIPYRDVCNGRHDCSDGSDEVICDTLIEVRLVNGTNGTNSMSGRVEVRYQGVWGTVCDDAWDEADAEVVCRMLGFHGPAKSHGNAHFGRGTGPILLDNLQCHGTERSIDECGNRDWYVHDCNHGEDAGVTCTVEDLTGPPDYVEDLLPPKCGMPEFSDEFNVTRDPYARIAGGREARPGAYPWQAKLLHTNYGSSYRHMCGASIISEFFVVTASHCVVGDTNPSNYRVRVGDTDDEVKEEQEKEFGVLRIFTHPKYNEGQRYNNDIALIQISPKNLGSGFDFYGDYVRPICLPDPGTNYAPGTPCYITGWGNLGDYLSSPSYLQVAMVPLLPPSTCSSSSVYGSGRLTRGMFCAGYLEGRVDTCSGDSGGPVACKMPNGRFALFGVTSWGHGCARPNKPGVYATVGQYLRWIYQLLNESSPRPGDF